MPEILVRYRVKHFAADRFPVEANFVFSELPVDTSYVDWPTYLAPYAFRFAEGPGFLTEYLCDDVSTKVTSALLKSDMVGPDFDFDPAEFEPFGPYVLPVKIAKGCSVLVLSYDVKSKRPPVGDDPITLPTIPWWEWVQDASGFASRLLNSALGLFYDLGELRDGRLTARRHAPGEAGHEEPVEGVAPSPGTQARIVAAARRYPEDDGELLRSLDELHPRP